MASMVEKISRLIEPGAWRWLDRGKYVDRYEPERLASVEMARAVLLALREPSEEMVRAAPPSHRTDIAGQRYELLGYGPRAVWQAMIDSALESPSLQEGEEGAAAGVDGTTGA